MRLEPFEIINKKRDHQSLHSACIINFFLHFVYTFCASYTQMFRQYRKTPGVMKILVKIIFLNVS
jgi:hypothetical protein